MTKVLLLSCDTAVRFVLARLLEAEPDLCVSQARHPGFDPDVVVLSLGDPEQVHEARQHYPKAMLLGQISALRVDLFEADVDAVLDSVAPYEQLLATIRALAAKQNGKVKGVES